MKNKDTVGAILIIIVVIFGGFFLYKKFSFTEEMARNTAKKFFNILMIKGSNKEFEEAYPLLGNGARVVTPLLCKINSVTKRDDGNYDVYAVYEASKFKVYPISIVVNRDGKVVNSRGVSYAYYDKTLEYGKKLGCLTGSEEDVEMEKIISDKRLRSKLNTLMEIELNSIHDKITTNQKISNSWGFVSGNVILSNNSPYNLDYGDIKAQVNFYSSNGFLVDTYEIFITNLPAFSNTSQHVSSTQNSISSAKVLFEIKESDNLKNNIKENIIKTTSYGCY